MRLHFATLCSLGLLLAAVAPGLAQPPEGAAREAARLYGAGKFQAALDAYRGILADRPADLAAHLGAGRCLIALGLDRTPEAVALMEKAVKLPGAGAEAYAVLGQAYYWHARYIRQHPGAAGGPGYDQLRFNDAAAMCAEALRRDPKLDIACYYTALAKLALDPPDLEAAAAALGEAVRLKPAEPDYHFKLGQTLRGLKRHEEAAGAFAAAAVRSPRRFKAYIHDAWVNAAFCYGRSGKRDLALQACKKAFQVDPRGVALFEGVWAVYGTDKARRAQGVRVLEALARMRPTSPYPHYYLGYFHQHMGKTEEARQDFARVLKTAEGRKFSRAWAAVGEILYAVDRNEGAAERHLLKALELEPQNEKAVKTLKYMITAARRRGDASRAIDLTRKILRFQPRNGTEWGNLGLFLREKGRSREAIKAYEKALALAPADAQILTDAGKLFNDLNENDRAEALFKRALEADPEHADALMNLGYFYRKHGQPQEARELFERALRVNPENAAARRALESLKRPRRG